MSTDLVPTTASVLIAQQQEAAVAVTQDCTGGNFLPQLRFTMPLSAVCKSGDAPAHHFVTIVDDEVDNDFGETLDEAFICAVRNRASRRINGETYVSFDTTSEFYKECLRLSEAGDRTCDPLAGRELLVFIPEHEIYATFLFGNKSMRRTANSKFKNIVGKTAKFYGKEIKTKKGDEYQTPNLKVFKEGDGFSVNDFQDFPALENAVKKFKNTQDKLPEEADDEQDDR